jgi:glyoxalase family protein
VAWASHDEDHEKWRERVLAAGAHATPVIDRFWFRSVYFREPSGVLFELATYSPGFSADESPEHLGETLVLPPWLESRREQIEAQLTPIENPRTVTA